MKNSVLKSKKFKYGGSAVALTVIIVALTLLLNVVVTSLSSTNSWYTDLTGASIYSISDKFEEELDKIVNPEGGEKKYINIVIMMDEDKFSEYSSYTNYVYHTIKQIEKKFDNVKLISKNIIKNPEEKERYHISFLFNNEASMIVDKDGMAWLRQDPSNFIVATYSLNGKKKIFGSWNNYGN